MKDQNRQIGAINLLRFLAATFVMFFHYSYMFYSRGLGYVDIPFLRHVFKYGYLGVELFFIISGFVIALSAEGRTFRQFLISRMVRLYPMLWLCATVTYLGFIFLGTYHYSLNTFPFVSYLANLTMVPSLFSKPLIDGSYWSLMVELKFYAFIGTLLIFGLFKHLEKITFVLTLLLTGGIFLNIPFNYASYFLSGVIFYFIFKKGISYSRVLCILALYLVSLVNQHLYISLENQSQHFYTSFFVVAGFITIFYFIFLLISTSKIIIKNTKTLTLLGGLTYPVYLLHQELGALFFGYLSSKGILGIISLSIVTSVILLLAYIFSTYFEQNIQKYIKGKLLKILYIL